MTPEFDVIVVGSGPAGVSAAFPLVQSGLRVLMVDGGKVQKTPPAENTFLSARTTDSQEKWFIGNDFYALKEMETVSPKLRVPTHEHVFEDFLAKTGIQTDGFVAIGSLAVGGLSNAWGCGVACLSKDELRDFPFAEDAMTSSYANVTRRIGISGGTDDDLSTYFGLDKWAQPAIQIDDIHDRILSRYDKNRSELRKNGFLIGRSRVAVLNAAKGDRLACDLSGNCLWGCHRNSLYSATDELPALMRFPNFKLLHGFVVESVENESGSVSIRGTQDQKSSTISAKKIVLAAGSLASTRLALKAINYNGTTRVDSCPTAAFLLWVPSLLGLPRKNVFGLGQLSYSLKVSDEISAFGSTFSTTGIPVSEFLRHLPVNRRSGVKILKQLLSSCLVGNLFLPGHLSTSTAKMNSNGGLDIKGGFRDDVPQLLKTAERKLRKFYSKLGAVMLPMSFTSGLPGGDIHYSGTLPMRASPKLGETGAYGELFGTKSIYIVDGAALPRLTEKSHTLTVMANADRIGHHLAASMRSPS